MQVQLWDHMQNTRTINCATVVSLVLSYMGKYWPPGSNFSYPNTLLPIDSNELESLLPHHEVLVPQKEVHCELIFKSPSHVYSYNGLVK